MATFLTPPRLQGRDHVVCRCRTAEPQPGAGPLLLLRRAATVLSSPAHLTLLPVSSVLAATMLCSCTTAPYAAWRLVQRCWRRGALALRALGVLAQRAEEAGPPDRGGDALPSTGLFVVRQQCGNQTVAGCVMPAGAAHAWYAGADDPARVVGHMPPYP